MIKTYTIRVKLLFREDLEDIDKAIRETGWVPEIEMEPMENWLE